MSRITSWRSASDGYSAAASLGASWLLHGFFLIALGLFCFEPSGESIDLGSELVASLEYDSPPLEFNAVSPGDEMSLSPDVGGQAGGHVVELTSESAAAPYELPAISVAAPNLDGPVTELMPSQFDGWGDIGWADHVAEIDGLNIGTGTETGAGDSVEGEAGEDGEGKFFGLKSTGDRFVFVVDASGSMGRDYPAPARNRFNRVKLELLQTIGAMSPEQKFFIIFFNGGTLPMPVNHMIPAEARYKEQYLRWMAEVPCGGDTEPEEALLLSLQLDPDVVYFLTDGAFAYRVTETVRRANTREIPIHTIGFGDNEGERWLLKIAEESGGEYQFITQENDAMLQAAE